MSIFSAVLMYQGINDQIMRFSAQQTEAVRVVIQFAHCAVYIIIMQVLISSLSGVMPLPCDEKLDFDEKVWLVADGLRCDYDRPLTKDEELEKDVRALKTYDTKAKRSVWVDKYAQEVPVRKERHHLRKAQRRMRCWAMLLAHMSGFAAINAGAKLQALEIFSSSPWMAILPAMINQVVLQIFFKLSSLARGKRMQECIDKEKVSGYKKVKLCHEAVVEAENDVSSLSLSFLGVQVMRFIISGVMPNEEGEEELELDFSKAKSKEKTRWTAMQPFRDQRSEPPVAHQWITIFAFFGMGLILMILAVILAMKCVSEEEEEVAAGKGDGRGWCKGEAPGWQVREGPTGEKKKKVHAVPDEPIGMRLAMILSNSLAMAFAWILLFGTKWLLIKLDMLDIETMIGQIVHALGLSLLCGVAVFALDFVDDSVRESKGGAEAATKAIRVVIQSIAILIGFSWEHCFDAAVADVAFITPHKRWAKFIMGCFVCIFLVPAWRRHILTKVMAYEEMKKQKREYFEKIQRRGSDSRTYQMVSSGEEEES
eukprot:symbB.v1.2.013299.t1/scaffold937.1/size150259/5